LIFLNGEPRLGYATRALLLRQIDNSSFKDNLLDAVESYNPQDQMVVLVAYNDLAREEDFCCQYCLLGVNENIDQV